MRKSRIYLGMPIIFVAAMNVTQGMQPYGHPGMQPGMQPMYSHDAQKGQRKQYKDQIKQQQRMMFFRNNPRATEDAWKLHWRNYKRMHGLGD